MIIPDICTNWHDLNEAKELIREAKGCGAGLVKGQLFNAEDDKGKPHYDWVKAHELTFDQAKELFEYGKSIGIEVFFSVFGVKYVEWCEKVGVKRYKLACTYRDESVIEALIKTNTRLFVSTTAKTDNLLALKGFYQGDPPTLKQELVVKWLYCIPEYPAKVLNFKEINFANYGFSDHTIDLYAAKIALARGARYIEKHFCLEHDPVFPDNLWSMTPEELRELVRWDTVCQTIL